MRRQRSWALPRDVAALRFAPSRDSKNDGPDDRLPTQLSLSSPLSSRCALAASVPPTVHSDRAGRVAARLALRERDRHGGGSGGGDLSTLSLSSRFLSLSFPFGCRHARLKSCSIHSRRRRRLRYTTPTLPCTTPGPVQRVASLGVIALVSLCNKSCATRFHSLSPSPAPPSSCFFYISTLAMSAAMAAALRSAPRSLLASSLAPRRALSSARRLSAAPTSSLSASLFSLSSSRLLKALPRRLSARQQDLHFSAGMLNLSTAELIAATTSANRVVVFSKSTCPFCHKAKGILKAQGVDDAIVFETDQGEGAARGTTTGAAGDKGEKKGGWKGMSEGEAALAQSPPLRSQSAAARRTVRRTGVRRHRNCPGLLAIPHRGSPGQRGESKSRASGACRRPRSVSANDSPSSSLSLSLSLSLFSFRLQWSSRAQRWTPPTSAPSLPASLATAPSRRSSSTVRSRLVSGLRHGVCPGLQHVRPLRLREREEKGP